MVKLEENEEHYTKMKHKQNMGDIKASFGRFRLKGFKDKKVNILTQKEFDYLHVPAQRCYVPPVKLSGTKESNEKFCILIDRALEKYQAEKKRVGGHKVILSKKKRHRRFLNASSKEEKLLTPKGQQQKSKRPKKDTLKGKSEETEHDLHEKCVTLDAFITKLADEHFVNGTSVEFISNCGKNCIKRLPSWILNERPVINQTHLPQQAQRVFVSPRTVTPLASCIRQSDYDKKQAKISALQGLPHHMELILGSREHTTSQNILSKQTLSMDHEPLPPKQPQIWPSREPFLRSKLDLNVKEPKKSVSRFDLQMIEHIPFSNRSDTSLNPIPLPTPPAAPKPQHQRRFVPHLKQKTAQSPLSASKSERSFNMKQTVSSKQEEREDKKQAKACDGRLTAQIENVTDLQDKHRVKFSEEDKENIVQNSQLGKDNVYLDTENNNLCQKGEQGQDISHDISFNKQSGQTLSEMESSKIQQSSEQGTNRLSRPQKRELRRMKSDLSKNPENAGFNAKDIKVAEAIMQLASNKVKEDAMIGRKEHEESIKKEKEHKNNVKTETSGTSLKENIEDENNQKKPVRMSRPQKRELRRLRSDLKAKVSKSGSEDANPVMNDDPAENNPRNTNYTEEDMHVAHAIFQLAMSGQGVKGSLNDNIENKVSDVNDDQNVEADKQNKPVRLTRTQKRELKKKAKETGKIVTKNVNDKFNSHILQFNLMQVGKPVEKEKPKYVTRAEKKEMRKAMQKKDNNKGKADVKKRRRRVLVKGKWINLPPPRVPAKFPPAPAVNPWMKRKEEYLKSQERKDDHTVIRDVNAELSEIILDANNVDKKGLKDEMNVSKMHLSLWEDYDQDPLTIKIKSSSLSDVNLSKHFGTDYSVGTSKPRKIQICLTFKSNKDVPVILFVMLAVLEKEEISQSLDHNGTKHCIVR